MASSPFFARIREQVLQLTEAIPEGRVCTYKSMALHLDVMPRHVAYILSQLENSEKFVYPWHRVVGDNGHLGTPKLRPDGLSQADLLREEGVLVSGSRVVAASLERVLIGAEALPSGLAPQRRPPDAPVPTSRPPRRAAKR